MSHARYSTALIIIAGTTFIAPSAAGALTLGGETPVEARLSLSSSELSAAAGEAVSVTVFVEADTDVFSPGNGLAAFEFEVGGMVELTGSTASGAFEGVSVDRDNGTAGAVSLIAANGVFPNAAPGPFRVELGSVELLVPEGTALGAYDIAFRDIESLDGVQGSFEFFALHDGRAVNVSETSLRLLVVPAPGATLALSSALAFRRRR
ncbi:MAG: hypothetical protein AAGG07_13510 [Planctomycetota bacterium]